MENCLNCSDDSHLVSDNFCGNFSVACGESDFLVWETNEVITFGTLSIFYIGGCSDVLTVTVTDSTGKTNTFEVPPRNTRSRTFANLVSVSLSCPGLGSINCEGRFCFNLHYFV